MAYPEESEFSEVIGALFLLGICFVILIFAIMFIILIR